MLYVLLDLVPPRLTMIFIVGSLTALRLASNTGVPLSASFITHTVSNYSDFYLG